MFRLKKYTDIIKIINEYNMINIKNIILIKNNCLHELERETIILKYHLTFPTNKNDIIKKKKNWYVGSTEII